jgi:hypothetical protein
MPAFAHEGENEMDIHANASTTSHEGRGKGPLGSILNKIEDRKFNHELNASTSSSTEGRIEKLHDEMGRFLGNIAGKRVEHVSKLFEATIHRFDKLITRFESRIAKLKAAGGVTTDAEASVNLAKDNIADAKANLVLLEAIQFPKVQGKIASTTSTTTAALDFQHAKTLAMKIRDDLRAAKDNLLKALKSIIAVQKTVKINDEGNEHGTSTASTTDH